MCLEDLCGLLWTLCGMLRNTPDAATVQAVKNEKWDACSLPGVIEGVQKIIKKRLRLFSWVDAAGSKGVTWDVVAYAYAAVVAAWAVAAEAWNTQSLCMLPYLRLCVGCVASMWDVATIARVDVASMWDVAASMWAVHLLCGL